MQIAKPAALSSPSGLRTLNETLPGKLALSVAASLFVAFCAHISVPLPFTPVPLTLGNFAVLLVGLALGPVTAFFAMLLYLAEGAAGLPVFNPGGLGGLAQLLGPTGGFLFSYPLTAAAAGALFHVFSRTRVLSRFLAAVAACTAATVLTLLCGGSWLAFLLHLSPDAAFRLGIAPFLGGEIIKVAAAAGIFNSLPHVRRDPA